MKRAKQNQGTGCKSKITLRQRFRARRGQGVVICAKESARMLRNLTQTQFVH